MSKNITAKGSYTSPDGKDISYEFEYTAFDSLQDAITTLTEAQVLKCVQRMVKIDANNTTREATKAVNGHSARKPMTEEQKAEAKQERQSNKELLALLKEKGLSIADIQNL